MSPSRAKNSVSSSVVTNASFSDDAVFIAASGAGATNVGPAIHFCTHGPIALPPVSGGSAPSAPAAGSPTGNRNEHAVVATSTTHQRTVQTITRADLSAPA